MAFVGNAELILLEIGLVGFVGISVAMFLRYFLSNKQTYDSLVKNISWAPSCWTHTALMFVVLLVLEPLAVYRVRLYGNWVSGLNLSALVVFWILQFFLMLYNALNVYSLWAAFVLALVSLGLAIATTWLFFQLEILAGVLMVLVCVVLFYIAIVSLAVAFTNRIMDVASSFARNQATWSGQIGAEVASETVRINSAQTVQHRGRSMPPANRTQQYQQQQQQHNQQQQQQQQKRNFSPQSALSQPSGERAGRAPERKRVAFTV